MQYVNQRKGACAECRKEIVLGEYCYNCQELTRANSLCRRGHALEEMENSPYGGGGVVCDRCRKHFTVTNKEKTYHCKKC